jgi:DeoR family transcriptional regulator, fructose operon transcriptional repressor
VKRAMIRAARRTVLLADHTKLGNDYLARFGELADLDLVITDGRADTDLVGDIEGAGVRVVRA